MPDTPAPPAHVKKLVTSIVVERGSYIFSGMGLLSLLLGPTAAVFLFREADENAAFLIGGLLLLFSAACFYAGSSARRTSQRALDEFVAAHDCECDLCAYVRRTPNTSWAQRDKDAEAHES